MSTSRRLGAGPIMVNQCLAKDLRSGVHRNIWAVVDDEVTYCPGAQREVAIGIHWLGLRENLQDTMVFTWSKNVKNHQI